MLAFEGWRLTSNRASFGYDSLLQVRNPRQAAWAGLESKLMRLSCSEDAEVGEWHYLTAASLRTGSWDLLPHLVFGLRIQHLGG